MNRRDFLTRGLLTLGTVTITGCVGFETAEHRYKLAAENILPADISKAPAEVREAYRFAIVNRDTLKYIPCYCGCGSDGHTSNASCYFKDSSTSENPIFDRMSLAWDICIGITRDVMKMMDQGKSLKEMRVAIDEAYSKYGPPTPTPRVPEYGRNSW